AIADKGRLIRLPAQVHDKVTEVGQSVSLALPPADGERWLPDEEEHALAALIHSGTAYNELRDCLCAAGIAPKHAERLAGALTIESLDDDTELRRLAERLRDETVSAGFESDGDTRALRQALDDVLGTLTERERRVVELRFGLDGEDDRTLEEI